VLASDTSVRSLVLRTVPLSLLFSCYCYCRRCHGCSACVFVSRDVSNMDREVDAELKGGTDVCRKWRRFENW